MNNELPDLSRFWNPTGPAAPSPSSRPGLGQQAPASKSPGPSDQLLSEHHLVLGAAPVRWGLIIVGVVSLVAGGVLYGLYRGVLQAPWLQELLGLDQTTTLQVGVGLLLAGLWPLILGLMAHFSVWRVRVTTEGLTWRDRKGEHHCTWDEVTAVYRTEIRIGDRKYGDRVTRLRLEIADGRTLTVNHRLTRYNKLCEAVQTITTERLLHRKRAEMRGQGATFGTVTLFRDGIRIGKTDLGWENFGHYYVENGHAVFFPRWARDMKRDAIVFRLAEIPNNLVLLALLLESGKRPTPLVESCRYFGHL